MEKQALKALRDIEIRSRLKLKILHEELQQLNLMNLKLSDMLNFTLQD